VAVGRKEGGLWRSLLRWSSSWCKSDQLGLLVFASWPLLETLQWVFWSRCGWIVASSVEWGLLNRGDKRSELHDNRGSLCTCSSCLRSVVVDTRLHRSTHLVKFPRWTRLSSAVWAASKAVTLVHECRSSESRFLTPQTRLGTQDSERGLKRGTEERHNLFRRC